MSADWIEAPADEQALAHAHDRADGGRFELWERERLVGSNPQRAR